VDMVEQAKPIRKTPHTLAKEAALAAAKAKAATKPPSKKRNFNQERKSTAPPKKKAKKDDDDGSVSSASISSSSKEVVPKKSKPRASSESSIASGSTKSTKSSVSATKTSKAQPPKAARAKLDPNSVEYWKSKYADLRNQASDKLSQAKSQILGLKNTVKTLGNNASLVRMEKETKDLVWKVCKNEKFRTVKFISDEAQLFEVTEQVLDSFDWDDYSFVDEDAGYEENRRTELNKIVTDNRAAWIKTYHKEVLAAFNKRRSYAQEWCKDQVFKLLNKGEDVPTPALIMKCAQRKINPKSESEMEVFVWMWEHLLPGVGGAKLHWSPSVRHFNTISEAHLPNEPNKLCLPVSSEAFLVLIYEGCYAKWNAIHKWVKANPDKKFNKETEERKKPIYKSKYFDTATGQKMFGGVPPETLLRFNEIKALIKKGRASKKSAKLEAKCLALVQKECEIEQQEGEEDQGSNSKKKKRAPVIPEAVKTYGDEE